MVRGKEKMVTQSSSVQWKLHHQSKLEVQEEVRRDQRRHVEADEMVIVLT